MNGAPVSQRLPVLSSVPDGLVVDASLPGWLWNCASITIPASFNSCCFLKTSTGSGSAPARLALNFTGTTCVRTIMSGISLIPVKKHTFSTGCRNLAAAISM